ncbi:MAG: hypothetical protein HYY40_04530 [Bacteroidetes bacterium]|nr:hypothetical protein [Bacteroidota bacterium]
MKTIQTIFLVIFVTGIFAQDTLTGPAANSGSKIRRHEINLGFVDLVNRNNYYPWYIYYDVYDYDYSELTILNAYYGLNFSPFQYGLGYKYHLNRFAIRFYLEAGRNNSNYKNTSESQNSHNENEFSMKSSSYGSRAGIEYKVEWKKFHFFTGVNAIGQMISQNWKSKSTTVYYTSNNSSWYENTSEVNYLNYGGGFFLGLRYYITDYFSLSTEAKTDYIIYNQKGEGNWTSSNNFNMTSKQDYEGKGDRININPIGILSVNIHL